MIYISHRLEELPEIADRVTVLRDGRTIDTREVAGGRPRRADRSSWWGASWTPSSPSGRSTAGEVVLELRGLGSRAAGVSGVSLQVRAGEIFGLAGLVGAGRTELARALFGLEPVDEGELLLRGRPVRFSSPAEPRSRRASPTCPRTGGATA